MSNTESRLDELEQSVVELKQTVDGAVRSLAALERTVAIMLDAASNETRQAVARAVMGLPPRYSPSEAKKLEVLKNQLADAESELKAAEISNVGNNRIRLARIDGAKQPVERLREELKKIQTEGP